LNFELGTVVACDESGCNVRLVSSGDTIHAAFSEQVKDRIRIRRQQLVAVNRAVEPPQVAWRWFRGIVESVDEAGVSVRRLDLAPGACKVVTNASGLAVSVGDDVYYGHHESWEVVDRVANDLPANPGAIAERYFAAMAEQLTA